MRCGSSSCQFGRTQAFKRVIYGLKWPLSNSGFIGYEISAVITRIEWRLEQGQQH